MEPLEDVFAGRGGVPARVAEAVAWLEAIPISAALKRRYLRAWAERTGERAAPADYESLTNTGPSR